MRIDEVDTLIDLVEAFVAAKIRECQSTDAADVLVLGSMRTSLKEYMCFLLKIQEPKEYKCPDCGNDMIQRKNRTNGDIFYGCKKYPECKGTRDEDGLSKDERHEQTQKAREAGAIRQQDGFSFNRK